jgi:hypothetical protein
MKLALIVVAILVSLSSYCQQLPEEIKSLNCSTWPVIKEVPIVRDISNPDLTLSTQNDFMNNLITSIINKKVNVPLSNDSAEFMSNHYFSLSKINELSFGAGNIINLSIAGEIWFCTKIFKTKLTIKNFDLVMVPTILKKNNKFYIRFISQIKFMDIQDLATPIEKCLANYLNDRGILEVDPIDIDKFVAAEIKNPLDGIGNITPKVKNVNLVSDPKFYSFIIDIE